VYIYNILKWIQQETMNTIVLPQTIFVVFCQICLCSEKIYF